MTPEERRIVTALAAHERAREDWQARGRTSWEATDVGVRMRDVEDAAVDRREADSWD